MKKTIMQLGLILIGAAVANANPIVIIDNSFNNGNGSFEYDAAGDDLPAGKATPGLWFAGSSGLGSAVLGGAINYGSEITVAWDNFAVADGSHALVIGGSHDLDKPNDVSGGVLNTGYAVQSGDIFSLSYAFRTAAGWGADNGLDAILFTSDDNTITGTKTSLWSSLDQHKVANTAWTYYDYDTSAITIGGGSAHVGKSLFIEFNPTTTNGSIDLLNGFARVDDVQLSVIPEPATLVLVGAFGVGILFIRRRIMM